MTEDELIYLAGRLFAVEQNPRLEKKIWFRLVKVLQGLAILVVILATALTAYFVFDAESLSTATLTCNDGTTWNAIDTDYTFKSEISTDDKCGLCNKRMDNETYQKCTYNDGSQLRYDSYTVVRTYEKDNTLLGVLGWTSLVFFGGLILVKIVAKIIVYVLGGRSRE